MSVYELVLRAGNKCYRVLNASANFSTAIDLCRQLLVGPKKKAFLTSATDTYENGTSTCARACDTATSALCLLAAFVMSQLRLAGLRSGYVWTGLWNRMEQGKCDLQWQSNGARATLAAHIPHVLMLILYCTYCTSMF